MIYYNTVIAKFHPLLGLLCLSLCGQGALIADPSALPVPAISTVEPLRKQIDLEASINLYEARKYQEAKIGFIAVQQKSPPGDVLTLAAFYEMECLRKLGDLAGLSAALEKFDKSSLTRSSQLRQVEIYQLWELVRMKNWPALDAKALSFSKKPLPTSQRAQIAYCHGLALEGLARIPAAIMAYQTALTADAATSEDIARLATLRLLAIYQADPEVQAALKNFGTPFQDESSQGARDLREAGALTKLFRLSTGGGAALPVEFEEFLTHAPVD